MRDRDDVGDVPVTGDATEAGFGCNSRNGVQIIAVFTQSTPLGLLNVTASRNANVAPAKNLMLGSIGRIGDLILNALDQKHITDIGGGGDRKFNAPFPLAKPWR